MRYKTHRCGTVTIYFFRMQLHFLRRLREKKENVMPIVQLRTFPRILTLKELTLVLVFFMSLLTLPAWPQQHDMSDMEGMPGMNHREMTTKVGHEPSEALTLHLADRRGSEFNHHLAGLFVFLAGIFVLLEEPLAKRWCPVRYVWPACFLAAGLFVLLFSDLEIWPFGPQAPWYALTHNFEDLQHKVFAVILLSLGYVELQRARGRFKGLWTAMFFPVVGVAGGILLLFHEHGGNMSAPNAMQIMEHIETQHRWFAAAGFGIAISKGLAEIPHNWRLVFSKAWPILLTVLGILLIVYSE